MRQLWKITGLVLAILIVSGFLLAKPAKVTLSTLFFIPQVFPQFPVKPAEWITKEPISEKVEFLSDSKKVKGEIWRPNDNKRHPAVIIAMGVRTAERDKPVMANFAKALARMGFVTAVVNLEDLQNLKVRIEEKETFIASFKFLENLAYVDKNKISFVGISVGSSIVLKAAEDAKIADQLKALIFFGGYFDAVDYFASLVTKTVDYLGEESAWQPHEHVFNHFKEVVISLAPVEEQPTLSEVLIEGKKLDAVEFEKLLPASQFAIRAFEVKTKNEFLTVWNTAPYEITQRFENLSPNIGIEKVKTRLFILHDRADRNVSYFESRKLNDAIPKEVKKTYLEVSLFEHVQPKKGFSAAMIPELLKLYKFIWQIVFFIS